MSEGGHAGYRRDIDGLRAIAVTSVVAFHANVPGVTGGFVGVDVFFVISGYLITQLLLREAVRSRSIALANFYARRVRRLLPALATVALVTFAIAHFVLLPVLEQPALARSGVWTAGYLSNIYFKGAASDYFAGPVDQQPLLHTWSLAVEEQYYLIWPTLVLLTCWLVLRRPAQIRVALGTLLALITVGSFALCVHWTDTSPSAAFYLLPSRAWELGIGALLAVGLDGRRDQATPFVEVFFVVGLGAIVRGIVTIDRDTAFPGFAAAVPVLGTACCIAAGALGSRLANPILGNPIAVRIGKVSYAWYLWHWPLLALARARSFGVPDLVRDVGIGVVALGLAAITLVVIENPIRLRRLGPFARTSHTIVAGIVLSAAIAGAALALRWSAGRESSRAPYAEVTAALARQSPLHDRCHREQLAALTDCTLPGDDPNRLLYVWGDSHAELVVAPVAAFAKQEHLPVVQRTSSACPPLLGVVPTSDDRHPNLACDGFNRAVVAELRALAQSGKHVTAVISARWPNYLATVAPSGIETRRLSTVTGEAGSSSLDLFARALDATVAELEREGIEVVLVATPSELAVPGPQCVLRGGDCGIPRVQGEGYREPAMRVLRDVQRRYAAHAELVDPLPMFCDVSVCRPERAGKLAYQDVHHLTWDAAEQLLEIFRPALAHAVGAHD